VTSDSAPSGEDRATHSGATIAMVPVPVDGAQRGPLVGRRTLRALGALIALTLLILWFFLVRYIFQQAGGQPAPAVLMLPLLFFSLAISAGVAALRDEPMVMVIAGGLSLFPMGVFLLFMPGFPRWIGILDICLVALGVILVRQQRPAIGEGGVAAWNDDGPGSLG